MKLKRPEKKIERDVNFLLSHIKTMLPFESLEVQFKLIDSMYFSNEVKKLAKERLEEINANKN